MRGFDIKILLVAITLTFSGCVSLTDIPKTIWGSSTRALNKARVNALTKTYDKGYWDCIKAAVDVIQRKHLELFKNDDIRGEMIVMRVPGAVDTTEVGVFFTEVSDTQTRIEIASLSTNAKRLLGKILFHGMDVNFGLAAADKEVIVLKKDILDVDATNGLVFYDDLIAKGFLEAVSPSEARLKEDPITMKAALQKLLSNNFDKVYAVLQKAWDAAPAQTP